MIKNNLNIDNVLKTLDKIQKSNSILIPHDISPSIYAKNIKELLDTFFDYRIIKLDVDESIKYQHYMHGTVYIKKENIYVENGFSIEFESLYPNLIVKLWKNGDIKFNIPEFGVLYNFLVENYKNIKKLDIDKDLMKLWKTLINYSYGMLSIYNNTLIRCDYISLVTSYMSNFYNDIRLKYNDNVVYIDTDIIYLDYITKDILNDFKKIGIPFEINCGLNFYLIDKKKFILIENGNVSFKGIKPYKSKYELEKKRYYKFKKIKKLYDTNTTIC